MEEQVVIGALEEFGFCIRYPVGSGILPEYFSKEELARNRFNELRLSGQGKGCALERLGTKKGLRDKFIDVIL